MSTYNWTGAAGDGNFSNAKNWSPAKVPGASDTAIITPAGITTIDVSNAAVADLTTSATVTLNVSNGASFTLGSGVATSTFSNAGTFALNSTNGATQLILGAGTTTLTGGGVVVLGNNPNNSILGAAATDLLTNVDNIIEGSGQLGDGTLTISNGAAGIIDGDNGTALVLNTGSATVSNAGLLEATAGGNLVIEAVVNSGTLGHVSAAGGNIFLQGGDLRGGTLSSSGGGTIIIAGGTTGTLDGTTNAVTNTGLVAVQNQGTLSVLGSIINTGTIALQSGNQTTDLVVGPLTGTAGTVTISGSGSLTLSDNGGNRIFAGETGDTLLNKSTIIGAGQFGVGTLTLINQGTINASGNNALTVSTGATTTNGALMEATGPGGLVLQGVFNDSAAGTLLAANANVSLQAADIIGGTLNSNGAGAITIQGSQTGTLDGSSSSVTNLGQVAINNQGTLSLLGTIINSGTISLQSSNQPTELVIASPTVTLNGTGAIILSNNPNNAILGSVAADRLFNTSQTISGAGALGDGQLAISNAAKGVIDANVSNTLTLSTGGSAVANNGLIESTSTGGLLILNTVVNTSASGTIVANGGNVILNGGSLAGGHVVTSNGGQIVIAGSTLGTLNGTANAVTLAGTLAVNNQGTLSLLGSIIDQGSILLQSSNQPTDLIVGVATGKASTVTLTGAGTITLSDNPNNAIFGGEAGDTLSDINVIIQGSGALGAGTLTLINHSTINATGTNALVVNTGATVTNDALMEATNTGGLVVQSRIDNSGGGAISAAGGNVYLQGGTLVGGSLVTSGGGVINLQGGYTGTLDGTTQAVTNNGSLVLSNQGSLCIEGAIVNASSITLASTNQNTDLIVVSSGATLTGAGTITLSDNDANRIYGAIGTDVLDNVSNTIQGSGQIGAGQLTLTNAGTIDSTGGGTLLIATGSTVVNTALLEATLNGGGGLILQGTIDDSNGGTVLAASGQVYLQGADLLGGTLNSTTTGSIVVQSGNTGTLDGTSHSVTSLGSIALYNQGTLSVLGTLVNDGVITLQSTNQNTDLVVGSPTMTLTGGGTIFLSDNGANRIYGAAGTDVLDNVNNTIEGSGQIGADQLVFTNAGTIDATGGNILTIDTSAVSTNSGLIEATGTGGLVLQSSIDSSSGGTVLATNGNVYLQNGTLAGGTINTSSTGSFVVQSGYVGTLDGSAHTLTNLGSIAINNQATLSVLGTLVNKGVINLQSTNQDTDLVTGTPTVTLTGGGTIILSDNGANRIYGAAGTDVLDNVNNTIEGSGQIGASELNLTNAGTIDATGGNALVIATSAVTTNSGLIEATGTGGLVVESSIDSSSGGIVLASAANVYLQGGTLAGGMFRSSGSGSLALINSNVGTLDGLAHALTVAGNVFVANQSTLSALGSIINQGTLTLDSTNQNTDLIVSSPTLTLSGGGTIALSDNPANRVYGAATADVLNNYNNTIEGSGQLGAGQLTLIDSGTIAATGVNALVLSLGSTGTVTASGALLGIGSGGLSIQNGSYTDSGLIEAQNASSVTFVSGATLTNLAGGTLTHGTYEALSTGSGATLAFNATITTDAASIILSGVNAAITANGTALSAGLKTITKNGSLEVLAGAIYSSTTPTITSAGTVTLGGGTLTAQTFTNAGLITGSGTLGGTLVSSGTLAAVGGTLDLTGAVKKLHGALTGSGTLALDGGTTTLSEGTTLGVSTIAVIDSATLSLSTSLTFATVLDLVGKVSIIGSAATNTGLMEQTGTTTALISAPFTNSGTILIGAGGGMAFSGGLTNTGSIIDNGSFSDTAPLTGGSLSVGPAGSVASIATKSGSGPSTLATLTVGGGALKTNGTVLTVTGDYNNTAAGIGNAYAPFHGVTGTIDGHGTQLTVVGVEGTTVTTVNGTLTISVAPHGTANFVIENTGAAGSAALRGALQTTVNGGDITGKSLSGSGVTAQDFGPIAAGSESGTFSISYSSGTLTGEAIHLISDFANVAGLTIDIVSTKASDAPVTGSLGQSHEASNLLVLPQTHS